jgi:hypothetical protein
MSGGKRTSYPGSGGKMHSRTRKHKMGCDIHLYIEKKVGDKWHPVEIDERLIPDERHYRLFGFLAGVRRDDDTITQFEDRGIPLDTSLPSHAKGDSENNESEHYIGEHSFTYAYLDEILLAPWGQNDLADSDFYVFCAYVLPRLCDSCGYLTTSEKRNVRIIMGFDS